MDSTWLTVASMVIVPLVIAVLVNVGGIWVAESRRKKMRAEAEKVGAEASKTDAETADVLTGTALKIVERMDKKIIVLETQLAEQVAISTEQGKEIRDLQYKVRKLEHENDDLMTGAMKVIAQLVELGETPDWEPRS